MADIVWSMEQELAKASCHLRSEDSCRVITRVSFQSCEGQRSQKERINCFREGIMEKSKHGTEKSRAVVWVQDWAARNGDRFGFQNGALLNKTWNSVAHIWLTPQSSVRFNRTRRNWGWVWLRVRREARFNRIWSRNRNRNRTGEGFSFSVL